MFEFTCKYAAKGERGGNYPQIITLSTFYTECSYMKLAVVCDHIYHTFSLVFANIWQNQRLQLFRLFPIKFPYFKLLVVRLQSLLLVSIDISL